jgi:anthranilate phosphoribosyltransferase
MTKAPLSPESVPARSATGNKLDSSDNTDLGVFIARLLKGEHLSRAGASGLLESLLSDAAPDAQIAAALLALAAKGETIDELVGIATAMRARAVPVRARHERFLDTAGTGSSAAKTFNVSTAAAFVIAAAGLPVAKHGNRAVTSCSGSSDVLTALGVQVAAAPELTEKCLNEIDLCFMFAPLYHGTTARVAAVRRELGVRTIFNLLGPLTNPAGAPYQLVGVASAAQVEPLAQALAALGTRRAWVVHGLDGLDEITLTEKTLVAEAVNGVVRTFELAPEDFGLKRAAINDLACADAESSARIILEVLSGARHDSARDLVIANAAAGLFIGGEVEDLRAATVMANASIDSGAAAGKLTALVKATNQ